MGQGPGIREFNRLYKELDDLYDNLALRQGLSDSASIILYALYLLGDGCRSGISAICPTSASRPSIPPSAGWNRMAICIFSPDGAETCTSA
ncbi:MAG: hypothetical protein V8T36_03785 [Ruthenibacterium lactatiformans]